MKGPGLALGVWLLAGSAQADVPPLFATVDSVAVRFYAPDTGGLEHPRFITTRQVSFEARLLALEEEDAAGEPQPREVRSAIDAHVVEEMLGALPLDRPPTSKALADTVEVLRASLDQRSGGHDAVDKALKTEGMTPVDLDAMLTREAKAALYLDSVMGPVLSYTEDQLRETYRTTSHPFRGRPFEEVREELSRWIVVERLRSAEQAYLQSARSRVTVVYF